MFDLWVECTVFDINLHNGKKNLGSTGVRIEAPFTKLHGFIDTLEGETARELEDSMTISG